jgi:DNA-binding ferritin-like protein
VNPELYKKTAAVETLRKLLSLLRAQYWMYQNAHWETKGPNFYGSHLLFQRIYEGEDEDDGEDEGIQGHIDGLAEKMVGCYGPKAVCPMTLISMTSKWIARWCAVECLHERALMSEDDFQKCVKKVYEDLKAMGELSLGMDDFLMAMASDHETNQYLLRQVLRHKEAAAR